MPLRNIKMVPYLLSATEITLLNQTCMTHNMAVRVLEFSNGGYKVRAVKKGQNFTFKVNFLSQKLSNSFSIYFFIEEYQSNLGPNFLLLTFFDKIFLFFIHSCPIHPKLNIQYFLLGALIHMKKIFLTPA